MGWFESSRKLNLPGFVVNAFGKLPFYKEYLYLCPDPAFADLKAWVDDRFERLSRQGTEPPYLAPNRHFMIHVPSHKTDLVGSIWESNDGLRTFPFMLAKALPRKARKHGFPLFWQSLVSVWDYFERYYVHLRETGSSSAFYKGIRGVVHQIPKVVEPSWPKNAPLNQIARNDLERGGLARIDLRSESPELDTWLGGLQLKQCPNLILWPQSDYATQSYRAMGYMSMLGIEALAIDLFQPTTLEGEALRQAKALAHGAALAAQIDAQVSEEDTSEEITLILGAKEKPNLDSPPADMLKDSGSSASQDLQDGQNTLNLPPLADEMDALERSANTDPSPSADDKSTAEVPAPEHSTAKLNLADLALEDQSIEDGSTSELSTEKLNVADLPLAEQPNDSVELPQGSLDEQQTEKVDLVELGLVDKEDPSEGEAPGPEGLDYARNLAGIPSDDHKTETLEVVELVNSVAAETEVATEKDFEVTTLSEIPVEDDLADELPTQSLEKFDLPPGFGDAYKANDKSPKRFEAVTLSSSDPQAEIDTSEDVTEILQTSNHELSQDFDQDRVTEEDGDGPPTLPDGVEAAEEVEPKLAPNLVSKTSSNRVVEELLTLDPEFRHAQAESEKPDTDDQT